jgi:hypothetical protein
MSQNILSKITDNSIGSKGPVLQLGRKREKDESRPEISLECHY